MGKAKIKTINLSQIKYNPQEGEIIKNSIDNKFYIFKNSNWTNINMENSGINIGLYDINKQIINQLPILNDLNDKKDLFNILHEKFNNTFYMLYGKEISYFTLFKIVNKENFYKEVIECLNNIGDIKAIDLTESKDAIEIWIQDEDESTCLYLFPYDNGIVEV